VANKCSIRASAFTRFDLGIITIRVGFSWSDDEIMEIMPAPDYPTSADIVSSKADIKQIYTT
jgi:DNA gyrase/topoisomerase IV subunit A